VGGAVLAELDGHHLSTEMRTGVIDRIIDWFDYEEVLGDGSRGRVSAPNSRSD
jgi:hypothetical protein